MGAQQQRDCRRERLQEWWRNEVASDRRNRLFVLHPCLHNVQRTMHDAGRRTHDAGARRLHTNDKRAAVDHGPASLLICPSLVDVTVVSAAPG